MVEKEVVKTVEVPGQTVVVEKEVVKTVEVPGETVVVEKEVVKTVEVPGQTVVVEKVVVQEVAGKKYVTDPSTGEVVSAPEYGGTITFPTHESPLGTDAVGITGSNAPILIDPVIEKLGMADWAAPRDKFDLSAVFPPAEYTRGQLAESWSQPDPLTVIVNVRQGVRWHDKAPMNGRELTAQDVEFNFHRLLGAGSGFTEPSESLTYGYMWPGVKVGIGNGNRRIDGCFQAAGASAHSSACYPPRKRQLYIPPRSDPGTRRRERLEEPGRHRTHDADRVGRRQLLDLGQES